MTCWTAVLLRGTTRLVVPIDVDTSESWCAVATYRVVDDPAGEVREDHGADGSQGPRPFDAAAEAAERARAAYFADEVVGLTCDTPQPAADLLAAVARAKAARDAYHVAADRYARLEVEDIHGSRVPRETMDAARAAYGAAGTAADGSLAALFALADALAAQPAPDVK